LFSSILNLAFLFLPIRQLILMPLLLMAGVVFLVSAFPVLRTLFPWSGGRMISLPYRLVSKAAGVLANTPGMLKKYLMGVLLGFMPCGLVTSALMAASSASNAGQAALAMAAFGLGTMPALILTAFSGHSLKLKFPKTMAYVTRGLMTISALWLFALAGMMLI
jgi:sulfite exporter TauE/SafE